MLEKSSGAISVKNSREILSGICGGIPREFSKDLTIDTFCLLGFLHIFYIFSDDSSTNLA